MEMHIYIEKMDSKMYIDENVIITVSFSYKKNVFRITCEKNIIKKNIFIFFMIFVILSNM